jgi:hypothetical protein
VCARRVQKLAHHVLALRALVGDQPGVASNRRDARHFLQAKAKSKEDRETLLNMAETWESLAQIREQQQRKGGSANED